MGLSIGPGQHPELAFRAFPQLWWAAMYQHEFVHQLVTVVSISPFPPSPRSRQLVPLFSVTQTDRS